MSLFLKALKDHWLVWILFFFSSGLLPLVNTIEGSFARTLISCDQPIEPVPGDLFSGSAKCGDRLRVINEGQMLSSVAAGQESLTKVVMMVVAAVLTDLHGRKPVLIVGIFCTALSIGLFLLACLFERWAQTFFIMGQMLQGAYPVELLFQQVAADLASLQGADKMAIFQIQGLVKFLPVVMFGFVASCLQMLELVDYFWLWCCVFFLNCGLLGLAYCFFPETKVVCSNNASSHGIFEGLLHELREYQQLFSETRQLGKLEFVLFYVFVDAISRAKFTTLIMSFSMSYYSMTAAEVIFWALPVAFVHTASTSLVGNVCERLGMRKGFIAVCAYKLVAGSFFLLQPVMRWSWFAQYYLSSMASGWDALMSSLYTSIFGERISKYMALATLCSYGSNAISAPMYALLFDAKASSYSARLLPCLVSFLLYVLGMALVFTPPTRVWSMFCKGLDSMQAEKDARDKLVSRKTD